MAVEQALQFTFKEDVEGQTYTFPIIAKSEKEAREILKRRLEKLIQLLGL